MTEHKREKKKDRGAKVAGKVLGGAVDRVGGKAGGSKVAGKFTSKIASLTLSKAIGPGLRAGHPWIFRDAVDGRVPLPGEVAEVYETDGRFVARGFAEAGPIALRVFTTKKNEELDLGLFEARVRQAVELRKAIVPKETDAYRLIHGEGDRLPGFVCDRYGPYVVVRLDGEAALARAPLFIEALRRVLGPWLKGILQKSGRRRRQLTFVASGTVPRAPLFVLERGMRLRANLFTGQKTGLFLDHRESRYRVRQLAKDLRVLNLYGYTGGFSVAAALGGAAEVETVDVAPEALAFAKEAFADNEVEEVPHRVHVSDVPEFLRKVERRFDLIIADPPSFAPSESSLPRALKSYRSLHRACLKRIDTGGLYLAASCSSHVRMSDFERTLYEAALKVGRSFQVLDRWGAGADHPRLLAFPEGDYLKAVLLRLVD